MAVYGSHLESVALKAMNYGKKSGKRSRNVTICSDALTVHEP